MSLIGYLDEFSFTLGETVRVRASSDASTVRMDLVKLRHGDHNPAGPGFLVDEVAELAPSSFPGRVQACYPGSFAASFAAIRPGAREVALTVRVWPTLPADGRVQGIVSVIDADGGNVVSIALDAEGRPALVAGNRVLAVTEQPLVHSRWYEVSATVGADSSMLAVESLEPFASEKPALEAAGAGSDVAASSGVVAAALSIQQHGHVTSGQGLYNGKIENPTVIVDGADAVQWAFESGIGGQTAADRSGNGNTAHLYNHPARAMTSSAWNGDAQRAADNPAHYAAIHFHDDDIVDAQWDVSAELTLPTSISTGVYAIRLATDDETDYVPFALRRPAHAPARPRTLLILPTYTYVAYANERLMHRFDYEGSGLIDHPVQAMPHDLMLAEHPDWGISLYDLHRDGSGACYSGHRRPIPNLRPDYRHWLQDAPRHLAAELYTTRLLDTLEIDYDVITDHDLERERDAALAGYDVVLTGSHPEYYSGGMLDAVQSHLDSGGSFLYLGGNGFYWVTTPDAARDDILEVRRWGGLRAWEAKPGEYHLSSSGELGGLWRYRGRGPNKMVGVGMCSQGWDEKASPYKRQPASYDPAVSWVFDGIDDELIGDFGLIMNGASGDELDRFDLALGSPPDGVVLATSTPHSDYYMLTIEDVPMLEPGLGGSQCADVRSDMVLIEQPSGGAVFSVGSICFSGSFPVNGFRNNVSRLVENVVRNFLARER